MELHGHPAVAARRCLRCNSQATYFRAAARAWQGLGVSSEETGTVTPLVPGRVVPLCEKCGERFDPRSVLPWDAPSWVVSDHAASSAVEADPVLAVQT